MNYIYIILNKLFAITETDNQVFREITFDLSNIVEGGGLLISIIGYVIVFMSLVGLWFFLKLITKFLLSRQRKRLIETGHRAAERPNLDMQGEITAAIGTALYLHSREVHDFENTILTIKRMQKPYTPWSSKMYNLTEHPNKRN